MVVFQAWIWSLASSICAKVTDRTDVVALFAGLKTCLKSFFTWTLLNGYKTTKALLKLFALSTILACDEEVHRAFDMGHRRPYLTPTQRKLTLDWILSILYDNIDCSTDDLHGVAGTVVELQETFA